VEPEGVTVHGGLDLAELRGLGIRPDDVLDFSASINPLGPPAAVRDALTNVDLTQYPDRQCLALRDALAAQLGVDPEQILVGNGSTELIHLLARAYLGDGEHASIFTPTFGEYEAACNAAGATVHGFASDETDAFRWNLDAAMGAIRAQHPRLVFLCNPNNPTGVYLDRATVEDIARAVPDDSLLVLDEAYVPLSDETWSSLPLLQLSNVVLLRSMTKDYALAGARLGYMLCDPSVVERARRLQITWSVSSLAQAAGVAALEDDGRYLELSRETIRLAKAYLLTELHAMGVTVAPSHANFLLAKTGSATEVRLALLKRGMCVRDCTSFGLPEYIRIGIRREQDCRRLIGCLQEVISGE
jgi:histidinol-phosphate aminotransferase